MHYFWLKCGRIVSDESGAKELASQSDLPEF